MKNKDRFDEYVQNTKKNTAADEIFTSHYIKSEITKLPSNLRKKLKMKYTTAPLSDSRITRLFKRDYI